MFLLSPARCSGERAEQLVTSKRSELGRRLHAGGATLGEVMARRVEPLRGSGRSVFDSTGLAIQDVTLARAVYDRAIARGIGTETTLVGA